MIVLGLVIISETVGANLFRFDHHSLYCIKTFLSLLNFLNQVLIVYLVFFKLSKFGRVTLFANPIFEETFQWCALLYVML